METWYCNWCGEKFEFSMCDAEAECPECGKTYSVYVDVYLMPNYSSNTKITTLDINGIRET
jgi:hypothetical protein